HGSPCGGSTRCVLGFGGGTRCTRAARGGCGCGGPTRSLTACGGPRARAGRRGAADQGQLDPVAAEVAPTWRLRGCHAGRREEDDDVGRNGRRTAAASGGVIYSDAGKGERTGRLHGTRGDEPTARIRRRGLDGGGLRRRQPTAREGGNGDGATADRFGRARASRRLRESVSSVGLDGDSTRKAGDMRAL
ncbi:Os11g0120850, partial [Oryza sativa Japonica Group]